MLKIKLLLITTLLTFTCTFSQTIIDYGGDSNTDSSPMIKKAILNAKSGDVLKIPFMGNGKDWLISKIYLDGSAGSDEKIASNITLIIESGVKLLANEDSLPAFSSSNFASSLITFNEISTFKIFGNGAKIIRPISNFQNGEGEWAHTFGLLSSDNITIENIIIEGNGGDGIYIGSINGKPGETKDSCKNILIDNVTIDNSLRNAISVIDVIGLTITNCTLKNTALNIPTTIINGEVRPLTTGPFAGIDFEPNAPWHNLKDITVKNNDLINNGKSGITFGLRNLRRNWIECDTSSESYTHELSIKIEDNSIFGADQDNEGILVGGIQHDYFCGYIEFNNNIIEHTRKGVTVGNLKNVNNVSDFDCEEGFKIVFNNTSFIEAAREKGWSTIFFKFRERFDYQKNKDGTLKKKVAHLFGNGGGITFNNTKVVNNISNKFLVFDIIRDDDSEYEDPTTNLNYENVCFNNVCIDNTNITEIVDARNNEINGINYTINFNNWINLNDDPQVIIGKFNEDNFSDFFIKNEDLYRGLFLANKDKANFDSVFFGTNDNLGGTDSETFFTSNNSKMYAGDFNGDGLTDIFLNGFRYLNSYYRALYIAKDSGDGFRRIYISDNIDIDILNSGNPKIFTGNFGGDHKDDLLIVNPTHETHKSSLLIANDNIEMDNSGFQVYPNALGDEFFNRLTNNTQIYIGRFNNDGYKDVFVKDYASNKFRALYTSKGVNSSNSYFNVEFELSGAESDGNKGTDFELFFSSDDAKVYVDDFNGDNIDDLFVKGYRRYKGLYLTELNENKNSFSKFNRIFMNSGDNADSYGLDNDDFFTNEDAKVYTGDFNGDGNSDLFVNGYENNRQLYISNVDNDHKFISFTRAFSEKAEGNEFGGINARIYTGNFDEGSSTDLLVVGENNYVGLYLSNNTGNSFGNYFSEKIDINYTEDDYYDWCLSNDSASNRINNSKKYDSNVAVSPKIIKELTVFPNPTNNILNIKSKNGFENIVIYDMSGRIIKKIDLLKSKLFYTVNVKDLSKGLYLINIYGKNNNSSFKLIKS